MVAGKVCHPGQTIEIDATDARLLKHSGQVEIVEETPVVAPAIEPLKQSTKGKK